MKTLDEVIESITTQSGLEIRNVRKPEKDRFWVDRYTYNDALNYLKMYRSDKLQWEADRKSYQGFVDSYIKSRDKHQAAVIELKHKEKEVNDILTDYVALKQWWTEQLVNPPLTWDELKTMEGKPVWVETKYYSSRWAVITDVDDVRIRFVGKQLLDSEIVQEMGKTWQAYRQER